MKKVMISLLSAITIIGMSVPVFAADIKEEKAAIQIMNEPMLISTNIAKDNVNNVVIKGKNIDLGNFGVVINNGKVMVPIKTTAESLGFKVDIDKNNKIVRLDNGAIKTEINVGADNYYYESSTADGMIAPEKLGVAPVVIDNTIYVPIKIYNLLLNDSKVVGSFFSKTKEGQVIYVDNGNISLGWKLIKNNWYFMNNIGIMQKGWLLSNGKWYLLDSNGVMQVGIVQVDGKTYYLSRSGEMQTGNVNINGESYSFATSGEAIGSKIPQAAKVFSKEWVATTSTQSKNGQKTAEISLEGNSTTGCSWEYGMKTEGIIKEDSNEYKPEDTGLDGSGGTYTWKFSALKEGTTEITFKYSQPWEKEKAYETKTYICTVDNELRISIKEK